MERYSKINFLKSLNTAEAHLLVSVFHEEETDVNYVQESQNNHDPNSISISDSNCSNCVFDWKSFFRFGSNRNVYPCDFLTSMAFELLMVVANPY